MTIEPGSDLYDMWDAQMAVIICNNAANDLQTCWNIYEISHLNFVADWFVVNYDRKTMVSYSPLLNYTENYEIRTGSFVWLSARLRYLLANAL